MTNTTKPNNLQVAKMALEKLKVKKINNLERAVQALKEKNFPIIEIDSASIHGTYLNPITAAIEVIPKNKEDKLKAEIMTELIKRISLTDSEEYRKFFLGQFNSE